MVAFAHWIFSRNEKCERVVMKFVIWNPFIGEFVFYFPQNAVPIVFSGAR
jgi:hypothetical protein